MYLRLWWKDARQFWPIWVFLILATAGTQGLLLSYGDPSVRNFGVLGFVAFCWATLYACAVGSAAFAGERETGTLRFLDILPASRGVVWTSKVSFAVFTTLGLTATLLAIAALGSDDWDLPGREIHTYSDVIPLFGVLVQALALGLFCSSIMKSAIIAAISTVGLTAVSWTVLMASFGPNGGGFSQETDEFFGGQLKIALAATVASLIAFTWARRNRRAPIRLRLQSPIVVTSSGAGRGSPGPALRPTDGLHEPRKGPPVETLGQLVVADTPGARRPAPIAALTWSADQPRPRSWLTEMRYLIWQTMQEGRTTWFLMLAIGLIIPLSVGAILGDMRNLSFAIPWNALIALVAGVSVFGLENRARTYRFLVHHGARPGSVWLAKLLTWCFGLAIIWVPLVMMHAGSPTISSDSREDLIWLALCLPTGFAVAQFCGMAIPRGITAWAIALVVSIGLGLAQVEMVRAMMLPIWGLAAMPLTLLAATWAWRRDWLLDRPAPGRYVRLGLILATTVGALLGGYSGVRVWSIPDAGPIAEPTVWTALDILPPSRNAAELYREAAGKLSKSRLGNIVDHAMEREALALTRQAAARPDCCFAPTERLTLVNGANMPPMNELAGLMIIDARNRIDKKDLSGAWDDIVVLLRMARHVSEGATITHGKKALAIEKEALDLAIDWATMEGQTPDRLHAAIAAYRDWIGLTPAVEVARAEGILLERTIDLPIDDLKGLLLETIVGATSLSQGKVPIQAALQVALITTPWERTRARHVNCRYVADIIQMAALEPWQSRPSPGPGNPIFYDLESTPLAKLLEASFDSYLRAEHDNEVARRAIVQVMAIRAWQLKHDGRFPDQLEAIVPDDLPSLPVDPYSGKPFGYLAYDRNPSSVLQKFDAAGKNVSDSIPPETRVLSGAGLNRTDDVDVANAPIYRIDDIIFLIPPVGEPR